MDKPTVAAVQGHAVGAGFQVALACDLRMVADDMTMGMFEIKFALVPDLGGNHRLTRLVGPARAKELVWTGRPWTRPRRSGSAWPTASSAPTPWPRRAEAFARELLASPPIPVSLAKSLIDRSFDQTIEAEFEQAAQAQTMCVETEDHREAVAAFMEKRPPEVPGPLRPQPGTRMGVSENRSIWPSSRVASRSHYGTKLARSLSTNVREHAPGDHRSPARRKGPSCTYAPPLIAISSSTLVRRRG